MDLPSYARPAPAVRAAVGWVPRGLSLPEADWAWRHRAVCAVLAGLVTVLSTVAVSQGEALLVLPLGTLLGLASVRPLGWRPRSLAASVGLLTSCVVATHLGAPEPHLWFVVVALVALYQDWTGYALALGAVLLTTGGVLLAAAVCAEAAVLVLFWRAGEVSRLQAQQVRAELDAGRSTVAARLAETDRIRADLIGTVSHEFRTPLTGIRGAALTLLKRGERLDPAGRAALLTAVLDQQERLSRLLENMLIAARATAVDPEAVSDVDGVAAEVAMLASAGRRDAGPIAVVVEPGTAARIDRQALHQVLANLVDNALQHGSPASVPLVAAGRDDRGVWITVSNEGRVLDPTAADRLFEPFTQLDSGATRDREGIGVGLYVVRRLVDVHGGRVDVRSAAGWVTVEVRLPAAQEPLVAA